MPSLKIQLSKQLKKALRRTARDQNIDLHDAVLIAITNGLASREGTRLDAIEQRLARLEMQLGGETQANLADQTELFLTDDEQQDQRQKAYQHWIGYFKANPDAIETGRTAHEMAALKASVV